jgi:hypothetical protein
LQFLQGLNFLCESSLGLFIIIIGRFIIIIIMVVHTFLELVWQEVLAGFAAVGAAFVTTKVLTRRRDSLTSLG